MERTSQFKWKATVLAFAVGFSSLMIVNFVFLPSINLPSPAEGSVMVDNVTLVVNFKNGTMIERNNLFTNKVNATVFDLLDREFGVHYRIYPNGYFVTSINGATGGYVYSVDGVSPGVASNLYPLANDSIIIWTKVS